jgi:malonyl-ACP decarboxylase
MPKLAHDSLVISGLGVVSAVGQGREAFTSALLSGNGRFGVMARPGRQYDQEGEASAYLGAELSGLELPDAVSPQLRRTASLSAQAALLTVLEAWNGARLDGVARPRIGLIVGGCNVQQRELVLTQEAYRNRLAFLRPTYGSTFMDTDIVGICTQHLDIKGPSFTVGGASASGQLAAIQAAHAVRSGAVDVCIAVGALMDLSYFECQAFRAMGAMGTDRFASEPELACRPFDAESDGFIFGEACGAIVIERHDHVQRRGVAPLAIFAGAAIVMDATRSPLSSCEGETQVIKEALQQAGISPAEIDYVNPHGSGSRQGDAIELAALKASGLAHARINATKSITGHGLTAAGMLEIVATLIQMQQSQLHPSLNLKNPIDDAFYWVGSDSVRHDMAAALTLSYGFGGINTAVCLRRPE